MANPSSPNSSPPSSDVESVLRRMADDANFASAVESNPTEALRGLNLTPHDIVRIEEAVQQVHGPTPKSRPKRPVASLAAVVTIPLAFGMSAFALTSSGAVLDRARQETLPRDQVAIYACPETDSNTPRAYERIGRVHRGDRVRVVGRTGSQWLVIRHPDDLRLPAWVPADAMDPDDTLAGIQEMSCSAAVRVAAGPVVDEPAVSQEPAVSHIAEVGGTGAATTSTSATSTSSPPVVAASVVAVPSTTTPAPATSTTLSASTTTRAAVPRSSTTTGLATTPAPAPTTTATVASTTTMAPTETPTTTVVPTTVPVVVTPSPSSTTSTTAVPLPPDKTGPTVALTLSRDYLYTGSNLLPCRDEGTVDLAVTLDDPTQPTSVTEATWSFVGSNGAARTGALTPLSTGRYRFGPIDVGGPNGGAVPVTFKVTASDGASNSTVKTITVSLRAAGAVCIG